MAYCQTTTLGHARTLRKQMTNAETILWSRLRRGALGGHRFRKQHSIGPYIADFASVAAKLVVEVDGDSHGADDAVAYDRRRDAYMNEQGWRVLRVTNKDVFKRLDDVLDGIGRALQRAAE